VQDRVKGLPEKGLAPSLPRIPEWQPSLSQRFHDESSDRTMEKGAVSPGKRPSRKETRSERRQRSDDDQGWPGKGARASDHRPKLARAVHPER